MCLPRTRKARPRNGFRWTWFPLTPEVVALPAASNNPYAALLFVDFLISPEGQKVFEEKFRFAIPTKNYGFKRWYPEKGFTTEQYQRPRSAGRSC